MNRTEMSDEELSARQNFLESSVRKDLLLKGISYQKSSDMKYLVGYRREGSNVMTRIRQVLLEKFDASIVSVGNGLVAIVKRSP